MADRAAIFFRYVFNALVPSLDLLMLTFGLFKFVYSDSYRSRPRCCSIWPLDAHVVLLLDKVILDLVPLLLDLFLSFDWSLGNIRNRLKLLPSCFSEVAILHLFIKGIYVESCSENLLNRIVEFTKLRLFLSPWGQITPKSNSIGFVTSRCFTSLGLNLDQTLQIFIKIGHLLESVLNMLNGTILCRTGRISCLV